MTHPDDKGLGHADDSDTLPNDVRDTWIAQEPPTGFVDRVMAARVGAVPKTAPARFQTWPWTTALAAACAALVVTAVQQWPEGPSEGSGTAHEISEFALGKRGTAVAQPGAQLRWSVARGGAAVVDQETGSVFYRVERGDGFVVRTPAGEITVHGTCFEVNINNMEEPIMTTTVANKSTRKVLMAAAAGSALTAVVLVTVYEGRVAFAHQGSQEVLGAGQSAVAETDEAPKRLESKLAALDIERRALRAQRSELQAQVDGLEGQIKELTVARSKGESLADTENRVLREQLRTAVETLTAERQEQETRAGEQVPWPGQLSPAYREDGLRTNFMEAIRASGLAGEVKSIDCTEFPCVVYGEAATPGDRDAAEAAMKRFEEQLHAAYPEKDHQVHESVWGRSGKSVDGEQEHKTMFAISVYPDDVVDKSGVEKVRKRLWHRRELYMEATLPSGE
jgi:hypothetical protein